MPKTKKIDNKILLYERVHSTELYWRLRLVGLFLYQFLISYLCIALPETTRLADNPYFTKLFEHLMGFSERARRAEDDYTLIILKL